MIVETAADGDVLSTITAAVTGIGLLATAIGVSTVKIVTCLDDMRKQVHRSNAEIRSAGTEQTKGLTDISRQLAGVRMLIMTHSDLTDHRLAELTERVDKIEQENKP